MTILKQKKENEKEKPETSPEKILDISDIEWKSILKPKNKPKKLKKTN